MCGSLQQNSIYDNKSYSFPSAHFIPVQAFTIGDDLVVREELFMSRKGDTKDWWPLERRGNSKDLVSFEVFSFNLNMLR